MFNQLKMNLWILVIEFINLVENSSMIYMGHIEGVDSSQKELSHINRIFRFADDFKHLTDCRYERHKNLLINKYGKELGIKLLNGVFKGMSKEQLWDCFGYKVFSSREYIHSTSDRYIHCWNINRKKNPTFVFTNDALVDVYGLWLTKDEVEPEVELKAPYSHPKFTPLPV